MQGIPKDKLEKLKKEQAEAQARYKAYKKAMSENDAEAAAKVLKEMKRALKK